MFQIGRGARALVLAGLASVGLSALIGSKWHAALERAAYKPAVTAVQPIQSAVVTASAGIEQAKSAPLSQESLARLHSELLAKFTTTHTSAFGQVGQIGMIGLSGQIGQIGQFGMIGQGGTPAQVGTIGLTGQLGGGQLGEFAHAEFGIDSSLRVRYLRSPTNTNISQNLVSMLLHPDPVVYVSETMPAKEDLTITPTRKLDAFEVAGLAELKKGNSDFVRTTTDGARMFGAIRAGTKCLICHGDSKEGALLGAFSYTVRVVDATYDPSRK